MALCPLIPDGHGFSSAPEPTLRGERGAEGEARAAVHPETRRGQQMGRAWAWPHLQVHGAMAMVATSTGAGLRAARVQRACLRRASLT